MQTKNLEDTQKLDKNDKIMVKQKYDDERR